LLYQYKKTVPVIYGKLAIIIKLCFTIINTGKLMPKNKISNIVIEIADEFGGRTNLADQLGVTPQAISPWINDNAFPPARALQIEQLTGGKFKAVNLTKQ